MSDIAGRMFIREGNHFVPADIAAQEMLEKIPEGKAVLLDHRRPRSPENHRHFFAILRVALQHLDGYQNEDALLDAVKLAVGHVRYVRRTNGEVIDLPATINFGAMPEDEFKRFKNRALYVLGELIGTDPVQLLEETTRQNRRNR